MIGDARGGPRQAGPGQPAQVNGMPTKKSVSTSKLSAKGEGLNIKTNFPAKVNKYNDCCNNDDCLMPAPAAGPGLPGPVEGDSDWVAPHQNTVTHVDPHAPLAGLPPGEGIYSSSRLLYFSLFSAQTAPVTLIQSCFVLHFI